MLCLRYHMSCPVLVLLMVVQCVSSQLLSGCESQFQMWLIWRPVSDKLPRWEKKNQNINCVSSKPENLLCAALKFPSWRLACASCFITSSPQRDRHEWAAVSPGQAAEKKADSDVKRADSSERQTDRMRDRPGPAVSLAGWIGLIDRQNCCLLCRIHLNLAPECRLWTGIKCVGLRQTWHSGPKMICDGKKETPSLCSVVSADSANIFTWIVQAYCQIASVLRQVCFDRENIDANPSLSPLSFLISLMNKRVGSQGLKAGGRFSSSCFFRRDPQVLNYLLIRMENTTVTREPCLPLLDPLFVHQRCLWCQTATISIK